MSAADVDANAAHWARFRKSGWYEQQPTASVEEEWEDHVRVLAEVSRRALSENRQVFQRLSFGERRLLRRKSRGE
jgi:hypothetical protein